MVKNISNCFFAQYQKCSKLVFMLTSLKIVFERKNFCGESSILAVTLFKNPVLIYILLTLTPNRNLIKKGYILKAND